MNKGGKIEKRTTGDGSSTLYHTELDETYHSTKGAQTESEFIYIQHGLEVAKTYRNEQDIHVLEVGFGTGLNAILTVQSTSDYPGNIEYQTYEAYPLDHDLLSELVFPVLKDPKLATYWKRMHSEREFRDNNFHFHLFVQTIENSNLPNEYFDVIYYDAFAPSKQADIWDPANLRMMYSALRPGGRLVTYCAQGQFKRDLVAIGFHTEHPPGPMGKKEMTIAVK